MATMVGGMMLLTAYLSSDHAVALSRREPDHDEPELGHLHAVVDDDLGRGAVGRVDLLEEVVGHEDAGEEDDEAGEGEEDQHPSACPDRLVPCPSRQARHQPFQRRRDRVPEQA